MKGLLKYNYEEPDATGVAHDSIDNLLAENRYNTQQETYAREGTIGPTPFMQTEEGEQALLDMVTGSAGGGLGGAIGRVAKGAITGGHQLISKIPKHIQKLLDMPGSPFIANPITKELLKKGTKAADKFAKESVGRIKADNKINSARILMEKALDKFGIKHGQTVNDPITEILRASKHRRN